MKTSDFYFDLPEELIAQDPLEDRTSSRLLVLNKESGQVEHHIFREIKEYLVPETKEVADTIYVHKKDTIIHYVYGNEEE